MGYVLKQDRFQIQMRRMEEFVSPKKFISFTQNARPQCLPYFVRLAHKVSSMRNRSVIPYFLDQQKVSLSQKGEKRFFKIK
jgi:hypothetical protein